MWTWRNTDTLIQQARSCEEHHRRHSAIKLYQHVARSPDHGTAALANYHLGLLYEEQHRFSSAIKAYRRATACEDPDTAASASYHLGRLYEHRHRRAPAIGAYDRTVRLGGPDSQRARKALARLLVR